MHEVIDERAVALHEHKRMLAVAVVFLAMARLLQRDAVELPIAEPIRRFVGSQVIPGVGDQKMFVVPVEIELRFVAVIDSRVLAS